MDYFCKRIKLQIRYIFVYVFQYISLELFFSIGFPNLPCDCSRNTFNIYTNFCLGVALNGIYTNDLNKKVNNKFRWRLNPFQIMQADLTSSREIR